MISRLTLFYRYQWIVVFMLCSLIACQPSEDKKLTAYIKQIKRRPAKPIEAMPTYIPLTTYAYPETDNRRSPFRPKEEEKVDNRLAPNMNRPKEPLEEFPLDALKFVGVLKQGVIVWGLISKPEGGGITKVKIGDYMGKNFGKVMFINKTSLTLEETVRTSGKWERKITVFNLNASH